MTPVPEIGRIFSTPATPALPKEPAHLTEERLQAFIEGVASASGAAEVEGHIDGCEDCRRLLSALVRSQRDAAGDPTHQVAVSPVTEGDLVAGKYKVERIIGSGGMGSVVAAWHQQLNQRVALKFMLPSIAADPQAAARFLREARAAARLQTPHVAHVLDLDSLPNGTPYLVMEFLEGETLAQRLQRAGRLSVPEALGFIRPALAALAEAHALQIVHRDFKPANLFHARRPDGSELIKVLDFGIAKSMDPEIEKDLTSTSTRVLMGSPPYMAPEQVNQGPIDARTDVWAVGVVLYELLSGKPPFEGATLADLMFAIQNKPHRPLAGELPLPRGIAEVIDLCLQKKPERRLADAGAVLQALEGAEDTPLAKAPGAPKKTLAPAAIAAAALAAALVISLAVHVARGTPSDGAEPPRAAVMVPPPPPPRVVAPLEPVDELPRLPAPATRKSTAVKKKPTRPPSAEDALFEARK